METLHLRRSKKTATVVGATGLIGSYLLKHLENDVAYANVFAISRSKPEQSQDSRVQWIEFPKLQLSPKHETQDLEQLIALLPEGNDFFSALGTTKAKAGGAEAFETVDYSLNLVLAKAALLKNYSQYLLVSASGADSRSSFHYNRVKGNLELAAKTLPFWCIHIFQPSLLLGTRNENRWGERAAESLLKFSSYLFGNRIKQFRPIEAEQVALCMLHSARETTGGIRIHTNADMNESALSKDLKSL